ncbi:MAG: CapA family protein [Acidobacteria bacterium]|nr:CapA family protein [Acidobacteriota bacterium]
MKKLAALLLVISLLPAWTWAQSAARDVTFALAGDTLITQKLSVHREPDFIRLIDAIRGADVAFANLEMLFHDYEPYPAAQSGGTYMRAEPAILQDIPWAGFDLVSLANNHSVDYGIEGLLINLEWVRKSGLVHAGVGRNLTLARSPGYLDSSVGRVALISCASTFPAFGLAGPDRPDVPGRPGLNPLRYTTTYLLDAEGMAALKQVQGKLSGRSPDAAAKTVNFQGNRFELADKPGVRTAPDESDLKGLTASIRSARKQADWVLVTSHTHEGMPGERQRPAQFLETFARAAVDAGADMVIGHGPHVLRGIEIYKGKPIFYSIANFVFQNETVEFLPAENYLPYDLGPEATPADFSDRRYDNDTRGFPVDPLNWESVVAFPVFRSGKLLKIELLPIVLGQGKPRPQRGRPMPADPEAARKIIESLAALSKPYGTQVVFQDGKGVITPR